MQHHAPHPSAAFEGYYSKFDLPSGANLALIVCQVKNARTRPNMLSFTYVPKDDPTNVFQKEVWVDNLDLKLLSKKDYAFILELPGIGHIKWDGEATTEYTIDHDAFTFHATTTTRTPWSYRDTNSTPEGLLVNLPLPLHWHVQSLASKCKFKLKIPGYHLPMEDQSGTAVVHQEKNWANSFPSAHMWLQARNGDKSFCCAGGQILGMEAFLVGYRSKDLNLDFIPPFAVRLAGLSPFMSYQSDWDTRTFQLSIQSFRSKIVVDAAAPVGTFFSLSSPFPEGHRENFLAQSFKATFKVSVYKSGWLSPWQLVRTDTFEDASLEFGGGYYPPAGSETRFH